MKKRLITRVDESIYQTFCEQAVEWGLTEAAYARRLFQIGLRADALLIAEQKASSSREPGLLSEEGTLEMQSDASMQDLSQKVRPPFLETAAYRWILENRFMLRLLIDTLVEGKKLQPLSVSLFETIEGQAERWLALFLNESRDASGRAGE